VPVLALTSHRFTVQRHSIGASLVDQIVIKESDARAMNVSVSTIDLIEGFSAEQGQAHMSHAE